MKTSTAVAIMLALLEGCGRISTEVEPAPTAASTSAPAAVPGAAAEAIGIPECDEYFTRAAVCFAKNPAMKAERGESIEPLRAALKQRAADPAQRERTREQCRRHTDQLIKDCAL